MADYMHSNFEKVICQRNLKSVAALMLVKEVGEKSMSAKNLYVD